MAAFIYCVCFLLVGFLSRVRSQSIVQDRFCEMNNLMCSSSGGYETMCCAFSDGETQTFRCCNPYIDLYIGLGVSVPIIVLVIGSIIVIYCCWWAYHKKKRRHLMQLLLASRANSVNNEILLDAPPAYSHTDSELPKYSEEDPYHTSNMEDHVNLISMEQQPVQV